MTRQEYIEFTRTKKVNNNRNTCITTMSVTDPSFAQTGRQQVFNPLPIQPRGVYGSPIPLNKDNPLSFYEYDKQYPDRFVAMYQAKENVTDTKTKLDKIKEKVESDKHSTEKS